MTATDTMHVGAERAPFVMLPRWLLHSGVSDGAKVLYCMLHDLVAGREGPTRPVTRGQLAECCGVSVDTVDRRLAELIKAGAVEKQAQFETHQGQLANVYWVRLSPPAAAVRPPVETLDPPGRNGAAPSAAAQRPSQPQPCGDPGRATAAPKEEQELEELIPPQPPRRAGGPNASHDDEDTPTGRSRRAAGTNLRAVGANPRAEDDRAEEARRRELAERREVEVAAELDARRAREAEAQAAAAAFEAESAALSGVLDDGYLAAVVERATEGLAGPLARSPFAVTRAVVAWCREAAGRQPGSVVDAIHAALADGWAPGDEPSDAPLDLPTPGPATAPLLERVRPLVRAAEPAGAKA